MNLLRHLPAALLVSALSLLPAAAARGESPEAFTFPPTLQEAHALMQAQGFRPATTPLQDIASSWVLVPAAVNAPGAYGAFFRTRTTLVHLATTSCVVEASFLTPTGLARRVSFSMLPAETRTFQDLVQDLFGTAGAGAVVFDSPIDHDLVVTSEVYVDGPNGRFSTATDTWTILDFLGSTYFDWTTGVRVDARTRANLACSNASYSSSIVQVALYGPASPGPLLKQYQLTLLPWGWQQISVDVPVSGGTLLWKPFGGQAFCYAVNVDNVSNDGTFLGRATFVP